MGIKEEVQRRRTFAIISHPDAGKTTLTEKFLLYGGAVQLAGSVTARRNQRQSTSDWMELERKRGISISSTVLQFDYNGYRINLLDTPGHQDFSEDTYRVLTAVDAVVMVIDAAKARVNVLVMRLKPVPERSPQLARGGAHAAAFQHVMPAVEEIRRIARVAGVRAKAVERCEGCGGPLPAVAQQIHDAEGAGSGQKHPPLRKHDAAQFFLYPFVQQGILRHAVAYHRGRHGLEYFGRDFHRSRYKEFFRHAALPHLRKVN